jgi:hypothetical protein
LDADSNASSYVTVPEELIDSIEVISTPLRIKPQGDIPMFGATTISGRFSGARTGALPKRNEIVACS